jgi:hypothetical protein
MMRQVSPQKPSTVYKSSGGAPINSKSPIRNGDFTYD